jgi:hypothetical protein
VTNQVTIEGVTLEQTGPASVTLTASSGVYHLTGIQQSDWTLTCDVDEDPGVDLTLQLFSDALTVSVDGFEIEHLNPTPEEVTAIENFLKAASFPAAA